MKSSGRTQTGGLKSSESHSSPNTGRSGDIVPYIGQWESIARVRRMHPCGDEKMPPYFRSLHLPSHRHSRDRDGRPTSPRGIWGIHFSSGEQYCANTFALMFRTQHPFSIRPRLRVATEQLEGCRTGQRCANDSLSPHNTVHIVCQFQVSSCYPDS